MRILIRGFAELDQFMMSLPYLKGVATLYPTSEIFMMTSAEVSELKELAPYVHHFIEDQSTVADVSFDKVIDLEKIGKDQLSEYSGLHCTDAFLEMLPRNVQNRSLILKESLKGFDEVKRFASRVNSNFDVVIYPFCRQNEFAWSIEDFYLFVSYFFSMNPGKKVLFAALESQREQVESFFSQKRFPKDLLDVGFFSVCGLHSVLRRSSFAVMGDTPFKHLVTNPETTLIEMAFNDSEYANKVAYRSGSYVLNFKKKFRNRFIYQSNELAFDNSAHFAAYIMTSIFDEDEEKLRWFAEKYVSNVDITKTKIDQEIGLQVMPIYWGLHNIANTLVKTSYRLQTFKINDSKFAEEFYNNIFDESDISQEQIMYDLSTTQREIEKLIQFFKSENHFATAMKIENRFEQNLENLLLKAVLDQGPDVLDDKPSLVSEYIVDKLVLNLFFIRQVMNVSGQKLLESLPMTATYYS